jgi:predicted nuclease with TOPRIM domain
MSRIPETTKSKYNKDEKFRWVDSQWEKYMTKMKELEDKIEVLENENTKLRIAHCNLRDEFLDLGGDPEQLELFDKENPSQLKIYESPDGGKTVYERNFGEHGNRKIIK